MWLDPMPLESDIHKAYKFYYTHDEKAKKKSALIELFGAILTKFLLLFLRLTPIYRERRDFSQMYLGKIKPGRLLELGCGNGARLLQLAALGWSVEGQEVDRMSALMAAKNGIKIHLGPVETLKLPDASYEAVVMNHVIEHIHDPVKLLSECRRLLTSNGVLISVTPNIHSFGHRVFKSRWRGLEPPRHVFLHCQNSLHLVAQKAGFRNPITWTTSSGAHHFSQGSLKIIYGSNNLNLFKKTVCYFAPKLFLLVARLVQTFDNDSGEECVLMLRKEK